MAIGDPMTEATREATQEAEERLAAALERIADMADGLSRVPPDAPAPLTDIPDLAEVVAQLDLLIGKLRVALGPGQT